MDENKLGSISKADSDDAIGEFWDSHDFTDFDAARPDAELEMGKRLMTILLDVASESPDPKKP